MALLLHGIGVQDRKWIVDEKKPPGFSRVYFIDSGEVEYSDRFVQKRLELKKIYIFPSYSTFRITHNPDDPINCLWYHLDLFPVIVTRLIEIPAEPGSGIFHLIEAIRCELVMPDKQKKCFVTLIDAFVEYCHENNYLSLPDSALANVLSYMQDNYMKSLTVREISRHFGYTPEHFIRMFRMHVQTTPYQYILNCRMIEAVRMLNQGETVKRAAQLTGYNDSKTFSQAFKSRFGIPPSVYRLYYEPTA